MQYVVTQSRFAPREEREARPRRTEEEKRRMAQEALDRAQGGQSMANYAAIFEGFAAMGIDEAEIEPRVNVLTFHAWRAKGRTVKRGEHGVKVTTWVPVEGREERDPSTGEVRFVPGGKVCKTAVVFHVSQTAEWAPGSRAEVRA